MATVEFQYSRKRGRLCTPPLKPVSEVGTMPVIKAAATSMEPEALGAAVE